MSISTFLAGVADLISDAGIGVWNPTGAYTTGQVGISIMKVPQSPDDLIVLTPYRVQDSLLNDSIEGLQIRTRGDQNPLTVLERDAALFNLFEGMHDVVIGGVPVALIWRQSQLPGPQDQNDRWECSSNYYCRITDPTTYRID